MPRARHAVAAGHALVAEAADEVLRAGGSAVDAAVAGALTACVAEPVLASLLGGGFLTARRASDGAVKVLDFFVQTPRRPRPAGELDFHVATADFGAVTQDFHIGAGSIATPGVAPGLWEAHRALGRIPFAELAKNAAALARRGAPLSEFQAKVFGIVLPIYLSTPDSRRLFLGGDDAPKPGAALPNPELGDVIETFALEGPRFMQEGEVAQAILSLTEEGGHLEAADLRRYAPAWRSALTVRRGAARISLNPAPSLGGALIAFALELLERGAPPAEVARAFEMTARARLESGIDGDAAAGARRLLSETSLKYWRERLAGRPAATRGTTHVSVVDGAGNAAALTLSNGEGCGLVAPGTGLMPNNMLGEEDLMPGGFHPVPADVRLGSMMAPAVISGDDGSVCAIGSGGSNRIRTAMTQVIARVLDGGARLEDAVAAPRIHAEAQVPDRERDIPDLAVDFEDRIPEGAREALLAAYPQARAWPEDSMFFGGVHAVRRSARGDVEAAGDHRRDGRALVG
ncbi:gamma-glutamyltransferase [Rhodovulum sp. DZ06]|uniref:gamma-glutamyltransferase n=1 Tax=Rhodovulum sp. DZ06 TaxID=3425126 RepID=UPI003D334424